MSSVMRRRALVVLPALVVAVLLALLGSQLPLQLGGYIGRPPDPLRRVTSMVPGTPVPLAHPDLREISGLASRAHEPGTFWSVSDGGNPAALYAVDSTGQVRQRVEVIGAANMDWEALSAGPCDERRCLYVGDVGDNAGRREFVTIYRITEPAPGTTSAAGRRLDVVWPSGPDDIEAMAADSLGTLWFITKGRDWGRLRLLRVEAAAWASHACAAIAQTPCAGGPRRGVEVARLALPTGSSGEFITDAVIARDGALLLRSYDDVMRLPPDAATGWRVEGGLRCALAGLQRQGESIAELADGRLLLGTEGSRQRGGALQIIQCPASENRR